MCVGGGGCYPPIIKMFVKMEISWSNKLAAVNIFRLFLVSVSSGKFLVIMGPEIFYVIIMVFRLIYVLLCEIRTRTGSRKSPENSRMKVCSRDKIIVYRVFSFGLEMNIFIFLYKVW